mmetsp:Transcript_33996/g.95601  ORF Transcript_33996/g.95601 Transcript_33996/m.95601 type:complete len:664 (+) Transcript_33996:399-2390(+)
MRVEVRDAVDEVRVPDHLLRGLPRALLPDVRQQEGDGGPDFFAPGRWLRHCHELQQRRPVEIGGLLRRLLRRRGLREGRVEVLLRRLRLLPAAGCLPLQGHQVGERHLLEAFQGAAFLLHFLADLRPLQPDAQGLQLRWQFATDGRHTGVAYPLAVREVDDDGLQLARQRGGQVGHALVPDGHVLEVKLELVQVRREAFPQELHLLVAVAVAEVAAGEVHVQGCPPFVGVECVGHLGVDLLDVRVRRLGHGAPPERHGVERAEPPVHLDVPWVIVERREVHVPLGDDVQDAVAVPGEARLGLLQVRRQGEGDEFEGEALLALGLGPVARPRAPALHGLLLLGQALGDELGGGVVAGGDVQGRVGRVQAHHLLELAPDALEQGGGASVRRLRVEDQEDLELHDLHRVVEAHLREVVADVVGQRVLSVRIGAGPVACAVRQAPRRDVELDALQEVDDALAPPVAYEPSWWLFTSCQHLDEGTILELGGGLEDPVVEMVEVEEVCVQDLPRGPRHVRRRSVVPPVALALNELEHTLELPQRNCTILGLRDILLEGELLSEMCKVPRVRRALDWQLRLPFLLGKRPGRLGADRPLVLHEPYGVALLLSLGPLQGRPDFVALVHRQAINHVDAPPDLDAEPAGLLCHADDSRALPLKAMRPRCELELC